MRYLLSLILCLFTAPALAEHWGDQPDGGSLYFLFSTVGTTGAPITIGGTADCEVYKDNSDTQLAASIAEDVDGITGLHRITIDTTVSGYDIGSRYTVVISVGTADSISLVGRTVGGFRLVATEQTAGYRVVTIKDGTGTGEIDTASGRVLSNLVQVEGADATDYFAIDFIAGALQDIIDDMLKLGTAYDVSFTPDGEAEETPGTVEFSTPP